MTRYKNIIIVLVVALTAASLGLIFTQKTLPLTLPSPHSAIAPRGEGEIVHYSTLMGKEFYDQAYDEAPAIVKTNSLIAGGTVNHHLLAAPLDAQFFQGLALQKPKRIILIGPDHLSRGRAPITTTARTWRTPYGDLTTDNELVNKLSDKKLVNVEEWPFDYEFSVGGLVPFVKRSLPQAKIVTIIVRGDTSEAQLDNLAAALPRDNGTIVVASIDFSHYLPSRAAEFHDIANRAIINAFDVANFDKLEIDSVPALRVLIKYLERRDAYDATLIASTDSAKITGEPEAQETTSYLNQYFSPLAPSQSRKIDIFQNRTALYLGNIQQIVSPENRFMRGFMSFDDGSSLPPKLKKPNLAVGIAHYADRTVYYLFPTVTNKAGTRLMTAAEEKAYFRQNKLSGGIITVQN